MKPTVLPWSDDGRSAGCPPAASLSFVGSNTRSIMRCAPARAPSTFWRLAIDTCTDGCRYGLGPAAHPWRNDGAEAAGRAARGHDQEMIRRVERGMDTLAAVAHDRTLSHVGPLHAADARALVQELGDVPLAPAGALDRLAQLLGDHDGIVAAIDRVVALVRPHLRG